MLFEAIFAQLMAQPVSKYDADESVYGRTDRLATIAQAVDDVSRGDRQKAAFLLVQIERESALRLDVQECRCPAQQCDRGRAHGLTQLHRVPSLPVATWWAYCGTSLASVTAALQRTARYYDTKSLECSYAKMGGGLVSCGVSWAVKRAREARRVARGL